MSHLPFSERDIERLLEGDVPPGRGDLVELARLFARVRAGAAGEPIPPMSARLLAELDGSELTGRLQSELERAAERRRVQRARRRWRAFAAAAAILVVGGVAIAALQGPLGDDLRTRPGDEPVSVAEPDDGTPPSTAGDGAAGDVETADRDGAGAPNFSPDDDPAGELGVEGGSSGGVATTEVSQPPEENQQRPQDDSGSRTTSEVDWGEVADECGPNRDCWIDAAEDVCQDEGPDCWAAAADTCGDDYACRYMLSEMCGDTRECWEATVSGPDDDHRGR